MLIAIAAVDKNLGIGFNNQLLEHIPEDLQNFKRITKNNIVVMGRKTLESLPNSSPLPNRLNIVITHQSSATLPQYKNVQYMTFDEARHWIEQNQYNTDFFIIGGASIYKQFLPKCDKIYLTVINKDYSKVDAYFPKIKDEEWETIFSSEIKTYKNISYQFKTYRRL